MVWGLQTTEHLQNGHGNTHMAGTEHQSRFLWTKPCQPRWKATQAVQKPCRIMVREFSNQHDNRGNQWDWDILQHFAPPALPVKILKSKVIRLHSSRYNSSTALFFLNTFETNKSLLPSRVILACVYFPHPGLVKRTSLPFNSHWVKPNHRKIYKPLTWSRSQPIKSCHFSDSCM